MKICLYLFFAITFFISCSEQNAKNEELVKAELLMKERPDSALIVLESMSIPYKSNKEQYATYCLLLTQAKDKNYQTQSSDSVILSALDYFEHKKGDEKRALAFFYAGRVNSGLNKSQDAITYYLKALDAVSADDFKLKQLIYSNLGNLFLFQDLPEQALSPFYDAYESVRQLNDSAEMSYIFRDLGRVYAKLEKIDSSEYYYSKAIDIARKIENPRALSVSLTEISNTYKAEKKYQEAISALLESKQIREEKSLPGISYACLSLGNVYQFVGQHDSALYYLSKALETENIYTKADAYYSLYELNKELGNYQEAFKYDDNYREYADSIKAITYRKEIAEIKAEFDQQKLINENNQLVIDKGRLQNGYLLFCVFVLSVVTAVIYFYQKKLLEKERSLQKIKDLIRYDTVTIKENEALIKRNEDAIRLIADQIGEKKEEVGDAEEQLAEINRKSVENERLLIQNTTLKGEIDSYSSKMNLTDIDLSAYEKVVKENDLLHEREKVLTELLLTRMNVLSALKSKGISKIDDDMWDSIVSEINILYNNYTERLRDKFSSLTQEDLRICCLVKLHLSTSAIAELCCLAASSITKRKQRMKEKMNLSKDITLDTFLWGF